MSAPDIWHDTISAADDLGVEFGVSADGFPVARIANTLLAMLSARDGASFLASAWRLTRSLPELTREDFHGHEGRLRDEATSTPWGPSQLATIYAEGIVLHMTAGHGVFHLSAERNLRVLPMLRKSSPWYE